VPLRYILKKLKALVTGMNELLPLIVHDPLLHYRCPFLRQVPDSRSFIPDKFRPMLESNLSHWTNKTLSVEYFLVLSL
jgi:hypothetical protein